MRPRSRPQHGEELRRLAAPRGSVREPKPMPSAPQALAVGDVETQQAGLVSRLNATRCHRRVEHGDGERGTVGVAALLSAASTMVEACQA